MWTQIVSFDSDEEKTKQEEDEMVYYSLALLFYV